MSRDALVTAAKAVLEKYDRVLLFTTKLPHDDTINIFEQLRGAVEEEKSRPPDLRMDWNSVLYPILHKVFDIGVSEYDALQGELAGLDVHLLTGYVANELATIASRPPVIGRKELIDALEKRLLADTRLISINHTVIGDIAADLADTALAARLAGAGGVPPQIGREELAAAIWDCNPELQPSVPRYAALRMSSQSTLLRHADAILAKLKGDPNG